MTYRVVHRTRYHYDSVVSASYGETHLHPRETPNQLTYASVVAIEPFPEHYRERRDYFGNRAAHFTVLEPHRHLTVTATSVVDVRGRRDVLRAVGDLRWDALVELLRTGTASDVLEARQYTLASPGAASSPAATDYAAASFPAGRPLLDGLAELSSRVHDEFEFAPGATAVGTPVDAVLARRAGVCQDFAHLTISALRGLGLAVRYVSGYLETVPPPGRPRLVGSDMSHAWVSVFVPQVGWVDLDPTNDQFVDDRHVTVAWGRDYADVPPVRGVIFTRSERQRLEVSVDVAPLADDDPVLTTVAS